jgi:hypothetical protein
MSHFVLAGALLAWAAAAGAAPPALLASPFPDHAVLQRPTDCALGTPPNEIVRATLAGRTVERAPARTARGMPSCLQRRRRRSISTCTRSTRAATARAVGDVALLGPIELGAAGAPRARLARRSRARPTTI